MSNLKRILSFLLVTAMLFTCVTVFAVEEAEETAKTYSFDLSIDDSVSENYFRYDAISKKDGRLVGAEATARGTWTDTWPGYWPIGGTGKSDYVFYKTEDSTYGSIIDMSCGGDYKSVVVFTAPEDGVYDIYFKGVKYQPQDDSFLDVALMRNGYSQPLATALDVCGASNAGEVVFDVKDVKLSAGDEIMLVTTLSDLNTRQGCDNFGIIKFDVTKTGTEGGYTYGNPTYEFGCDLTTKTCGNFYLAGRDAEGKIDRLQMTLGTAWGEWKGWRLSDNSDYVFCETQVANSKLSGDPHGLKDQFAYIDMMPKESYDSVVVFTAPVSGTYSFDALFSKLAIMVGRLSGYKIEALKGDEVLASHTFATQTPAEKHEDANLTGSDIYLKTGETIMFVASHVSDNPHDAEIAIRSIEVTLVSASCEHEWENAVCKNCYSYCIHEWDNGVCSTCGAVCDHKWNNGVCDYCEASCYHDWSYENGESTCALCGRVTDEIYVEYVSNLATNKTVDGNFFLAGFRKDGVVCKVEDAPRGTWSESYPGNWVAGATTPGAYITQKTECSFNPDVKFDMYPTADETYAAALVFEAPADGIYNVSAKLQVLYSAKVKVVLLKNGTELLSKKANEWRELIDITYGNIELNKGDQLVIAVYKGDAGDALNTGYVSFNVGGLFATCPHVWDAETGTCSVCNVSCPGHEGGEATCQKGAICDICGYEYTEKNSENHGEISYVANGDKTHKVVCEFGCVIDEDVTCELDENNVCKDCKHDYTVKIAEDNFNEVFDSVFNDVATDYKAQGPASLDDLNAAVQGEKVDGFTYGGFNLEMTETVGNTVKLRHHVLLADGLTVKVNGEEVTPTKVNGNYYYFEVEVEIGKFSETHTITVNEKTVVTASVHSYMKTAFEADKKNPTALTDAQENLLKALYDWDYAVANAN